MERQHGLRDIVTKLLRRAEDRGHATLEITGAQGGLLIPVEDQGEQAEYFRQGYTRVYIIQMPLYYRSGHFRQHYYYLKPDGSVLGKYVHYFPDEAPRTGDLNLPVGATYSLEERWTEDPPVKQVMSHAYHVGDHSYFTREHGTEAREVQIPYATRRSNLPGGEKHPSKEKEDVLYLHVPHAYVQKLEETIGGISGWATIVQRPSLRKRGAPAVDRRVTGE